MNTRFRTHDVTTQRTSKIWKSLLALSVLGFVVSLSWVFMALYDGDTNTAFLGALIMFMFAFLAAAAEVATWWFHG